MGIDKKLFLLREAKCQICGYRRKIGCFWRKPSCGKPGKFPKLGTEEKAGVPRENQAVASRGSATN